MTTTNWWTPSGFPTSEATFNTALLPQNISAYFRRPAKITKPSSRNQSPRTFGRRRTTTHLPARTRSVADAQRPNTNGRQQTHKNVTPSRPISWHPNYVNEFEQYPMASQQFYSQSSDIPTNTTFAYGLVTPSTYPVTEPFLDCPNVLLEQMHEQDFSFVQDNYQAPYSYPYANDAISPDYTSTNWVPYQATDSDIPNMAWPPLPSAILPNLATAPTSPDFLPMPDLGQSFDVAQIEEAVDKDELVGMGLYDSPAQVQSANLLLDGPLPVRKKSLKLEESFEPAPDSDNADDDAEYEPTQPDASVSTDDVIPEAASFHHENEPIGQYFSNEPSYNPIPQQLLQTSFAAGYPDQQGMASGAMSNWF